MKLEVPPTLAVYSPTVDTRGKQIQPWDDARYDGSGLC